MGNWQHLICLTATALVLGHAAQAACDMGHVDLRGDFGQIRFQVDVADDGHERGRGLMFVEELPRLTGMLFVYPNEQDVSFWMKNTLIPLDMIFADGDGVVQKVHANAQPGNLTPIHGGDDIQFVLEINGGLAAQFGITEGSELRHSAIAGEDVAWPCPN